jgi:hypothetical protein
VAPQDTRCRGDYWADLRFGVPPVRLADLDTLCRTTGASRSAVVRVALADYLSGLRERGEMAFVGIATEAGVVAPFRGPDERN